MSSAPFERPGIGPLGAPMPGLLAADSGHYDSSWIDRLTRRVEALHAPWAVYLALWAVLLGVQTVVKWQDGSYPAGTLYPLHGIFAGLGIFALAALHYVDEAAGHALTTFRPVLTLNDKEYANLRYRLTVMPARPVLLLTLVAFSFPVVLLTAGGTMAPAILHNVFDPVKLYTSPLAWVVDGAIHSSIWVMWAVFVYHTIRQLRLVSEIYARYTHVNLLQPGPLYAFSKLTARTALALVGVGYAFYLAVPAEALEVRDSVSFFTTSAWTPIGILAVAVATFVWPLAGIHRLMQQEKERLKAEAARRLEAAIAEMHRRADSGDLERMDMLSSLLDSLLAEQSMLEKIPTWPWHPETVRLIASAVLLPLVLYSFQLLVGTLLAG